MYEANMSGGYVQGKMSGFQCTRYYRTFSGPSDVQSDIQSYRPNVL